MMLKVIIFYSNWPERFPLFPTALACVASWCPAVSSQPTYNIILCIWRISPNPENMCTKSFCQCGKGHNILYVIFNTGQKVFTNETRWRNWWKFSPGKNIYIHMHGIIITFIIICDRPHCVGYRSEIQADKVIFIIFHFLAEESFLDTKMYMVTYFIYMHVVPSICLSLAVVSPFAVGSFSSSVSISA